MTRLRSAFLASLAVLLSPMAAVAGLIDGGFEGGIGGSTPWGVCGGTGLETDAPISGSQSLLLSGDNGDCGGFSVAFQFVAVDGSHFSVGDEIFLEGLIEFLDGGINPAYIEIAFATGFDNSQVDFGGAALSDFFFTPGSYHASTSIISIPELVFGAPTAYIRVAAALITFGDFNDAPTALVDDLRLVKVPEPGTLALLGIGLFGMGFARRRA